MAARECSPSRTCATSMLPGPSRLGRTTTTGFTSPAAARAVDAQATAHRQRRGHQTSWCVNWCLAHSLRAETGMGFVLEAPKITPSLLKINLALLGQPRQHAPWPRGPPRLHVSASLAQLAEPCGGDGPPDPHQWCPQGVRQRHSSRLAQGPTRPECPQTLPCCTHQRRGTRGRGGGGGAA